MHYANYIYKWFLSITLIVTLSAFNETYYDSAILYQNTTTEWVFTGSSTSLLNTTHYNSKKKSLSKKLSTFYCFNFDCFLNSQKLIFNNAFFVQNKNVLYIKSNIESNYIRIINTSNEYSPPTSHSFICFD